MIPTVGDRPGPGAPAPAAGTASGRLLGLDGIRGLAILCVMVLHATLYGGVPVDRLNDWVYRLALTGWIGVDIFFVLSGFLITGILYDTRGCARYLRTFYARRILRIFPLYYAALVLSMWVLPFAAALRPSLDGLAADGAWYWLYLANLRIALEGWPEAGVIGHFWSLAVEEQFYVVWPFVVLALGRRALVNTCVAMIVGSLAFRLLLHAVDEPTAAYVLTPARMDSLAAGALIALVARGPGGLARIAGLARRSGRLGAALLLGLFLWLGGLDVEHVVVGTVGFSLTAAVAAALLVSVLRAPAASPLSVFFAAAPLRFFGRYSYALYVIHHPLILLRPDGWSIEALAPLVGGWLPALALYVTAFIGICLLPALLSWHLLEKHFLRLKSGVQYRPRPALLSLPENERV